MQRKLIDNYLEDEIKKMKTDKRVNKMKMIFFFYFLFESLCFDLIELDTILFHLPL